MDRRMRMIFYGAILGFFIFWFIYTMMNGFFSLQG
jgi:hypothetical protein